MINSFVGLENLPNIYFRDIVISNSNEKNDLLIVSIKLIVKDMKVDGKFTWSTDDLLSTYLNVKILQSLDKEFTNQMTNGLYTLNHFDYKKSPQYSDDVVKTMIKRLQPKDDPNFHLVGDNMYEFEYSFEFTIKNSQLANVAYFASLTLDTASLSSDFPVDLEEESIKYFQGPISSEKLFVDGQIQNKTNVFYLPDNTVWSGPVHEHDGQFMAGAFHRPESHPVLRVVETQNLKLKDIRDKSVQAKKYYDPNNVVFFGEPYDTRDEDGNIKRLLSFNIESIFLQKTKYGSIIKNIDTNIYENILSNFKIYKLLIKRKFVTKTKIKNSFKQNKEGFKVVDSRTDNALIYTDVSDTKVPLSDKCEFMEISAGNSRYRYFSFVDMKIKDLKYGNYVHEIDLSFIDKTKEALLSLIRNYRQDIKELENYLLRANKNKSKDFNNKLNDSFFKNEFDFYGLSSLDNSNSAVWLRAPANYSKLKSYLYLLTDEEKISYYQTSYNSINPKTGTSKNINLFIQEYSKLINEFTNKFDLDKVFKGTFSGRRLPRKTLGENPSMYVKMNKTFNQILTPSQLTPGYKIIELDEEEENKTSINIFTRSQYSNRISQEKDRFFIQNPSLDKDETKNFNPEELEALIDIDTFSTSYLSPTRLFYGSTKIDLRQSDVVNNQLLNKTISKIKKRKGKKRSFKKSYSLRKLRGASRKVSDGDNRFENASAYLGDNSKFLNLSSEFATEDLDLIDKVLVREKFRSSVKKKKARKLIKNFDLKKENNVLFKKKRKKSKRLRRQLREIPMHLKAVVTSRSSAVKNNLLSLTVDALASTSKSDSLLIQHFAVQKIEYLDGYVLDSHGNEIFNMPNWKKLDSIAFENNPNKTFICRIEQYTDQLMELELPEDLSFEIFDKFFIIKPESEQAEQQVEERNLVMESAMNLQTQETINYDYCTSNPISQPLKENGIFTSPPDPNKESSNVASSNRGQALSSRQRRGRQTGQTTTSTNRSGY